MKTAKQKMEEWIDSFEYPHANCDIGCLWINKHGGIRLSTFCSTQHIVCDLEFKSLYGIFKNGQMYGAPTFEDDKPEPKDKELQSYLKHFAGNASANVFEEINERIKALEANISSESTYANDVSKK